MASKGRSAPSKRELEEIAWSQVAREELGILQNEQMKVLLGGEFPEYDGFSYDQVSDWRLIDGIIVPFAGKEPCLEGPMFAVVLTEGNAP